MSSHGSFSGMPRTEWVSDPNHPDRNMRMLAEFSYTDPEGRVWAAPVGSLINGASIPRSLWSTVGSPYTDDYRLASIVHDIACDNPEVPRKQADKMFYYACMAGGCSGRQAGMMYIGVRIGAWASGIRRLDHIEGRNSLFRLPGSQDEQEAEVVAMFSSIVLDLRKLGSDPDFADLERLVDGKLK